MVLLNKIDHRLESVIHHNLEVARQLHNQALNNNYVTIDKNVISEK